MFLRKSIVRTKQYIDLQQLCSNQGHLIVSRPSQSRLIVYLTKKEEGSLWFYAPNKGAAIAFAILFAISGGIHANQSLYVTPTHYETPN